MDESTVLGKKYILAQKICANEQIIDLRPKNEKSKSKSPKKKAKKLHSKPNKAAVASIQKKL